MSSDLARKLDAADGKMDGKFHGAPIVEAGRTSGGAVHHQSDLARRIDAADGKMDGRFFGAPIVERRAAGPAYVTSPTAYTSGAYVDRRPVAYAPGPAYVSGYASAYPAYASAAPAYYSERLPQTAYVERAVAPAPQSDLARRIDAADGKMDGRFFGAPIVEAGAARVVASPTRYVSGGGSITRGGYYGASYPASYYGGGYGYTSGSVTRRYVDAAPALVEAPRAYFTEAPRTIVAAEQYPVQRYAREAVEYAPRVYSGGYTSSRIVDDGYQYGASASRYYGGGAVYGGSYYSGSPIVIDGYGSGYGSLSEGHGHGHGHGGHGHGHGHGGHGHGHGGGGHGHGHGHGGGGHGHGHGHGSMGGRGKWSETDSEEEEWPSDHCGGKWHKEFDKKKMAEMEQEEKEWPSEHCHGKWHREYTKKKKGGDEKSAGGASTTVEVRK